MPKLLTRGCSNPKTRKMAEALGVRNAILHLAPASLSGRNVCPWSTQGCRDACLNTAGRGATSAELLRTELEGHPIHRARLRRTDEFFADRQDFMDRLGREISTLRRSARDRGLTAAVRLNGTSDIPWESTKCRTGMSLPLWFSEVQFYDYTKSANRALESVQAPNWPANYHLTYSRTEEDSDGKIKDLLAAGVSVAVVFAGSLPLEYLDHRVIDGTTHDFRFMDPPGSVVGLVALGRGRKDTSGFVVHHAE